MYVRVYEWQLFKWSNRPVTMKNAVNIMSWWTQQENWKRSLKPMATHVSHNADDDDDDGGGGGGGASGGGRTLQSMNTWHLNRMVNKRSTNPNL